METLPYSEVRAHLAETLKRLEAREEPVYISRRGELAGVLLSVEQYRRLAGGEAGFGEALRAWRERHAADLAREAAEGTYEDPWADVRDPQPPRPFTWPDDIAEEAPATARAAAPARKKPTARRSSSKR